MKALLPSGLVAALILGASHPNRAQTVPVAENLWRLVEQADTDGDRRITVNDRATAFQLRNGDGVAVRELETVYELSIALQELKRAEDRRRAAISIGQFRFDENVVDRTSRLIREFYWDALTRRIDADHLDQVVPDPKVASKADYLYVPASDNEAVEYFQSLERAAADAGRSPALKVVLLPAPESVTGDFVRRLDGRHGLLSLKLERDSEGKVRGVPYVVPGGRFNEVYYWDSYFTVLGLLKDGRVDLARGMTDNLLYALEHYGRIPNANRSYYLTRSQPPFLTSMIRAVYEANGGDKRWLESALRHAIAEYEQVWLGRDRRVVIGQHVLSRYYDGGSGPAPEVEPGHYDEKIEPWLVQVNGNDKQRALTPLQFLGQYLYCGSHADLKADGLTLSAFFKHDRAVRESGHDTTHRFDDRTADFASVDLNSLLYKYEADLAALIESEFGGALPGVAGERARSDYWRRRAAARKEAMLELMWDNERGFFFDYDFANRKRSVYISATGLFPLWAGVLDPADASDRARARRIASFAQEKLEQGGGLAASARESVRAAQRHDARQWDYPFGWAPHQMLAWDGLRKHRMNQQAERLAYRWLYTIAKNAHDHNGTIPEKYDVVTGSHAVFVEYGNVGTKFAYIAPEGFGWMNASFQVGRDYLSPERLADLTELKPPPPVPAQR